MWGAIPNPFPSARLRRPIGHLPSLLPLFLLVSFAAASQQPKAHPVAIDEKDAGSTEACLSCHEGLVKTKVVHPAVKDVGCAACHEVKTDGTSTTISLLAQGSELCFVCHEEIKNRIATAKVKHGLLEVGACTDCHDPHGSNQERLLKEPVKALCESCHADVVAEKKYIHRPVETSCVLCHDAHASDFSKHLHAGLNNLCLECHGPKALSIARGEGPVALFNGHVSLPAKPFEQIRWLRLDSEGKRGHPFPNHPVFSSSAANHTVFPSPGDSKGEINCLSCHLPHAANGSPDLLVTEKADSSVLCVRCHG